MKIAVLTGGGDCPGLNAVIRAVVRRGEQQGLEVMGVREGWRGLMDPPLHDRLTREATSGILHLGGTILGTSRTNPFKKPGGAEMVIKNLKALNVGAVVAIGGEDTLGVATKLHTMGVNVVGVPKTIDNDLSGTDLTFGFETRATVLGHIQRGGPPTAFDRVLGTRFGVHAADMVAKGEWGKMAALRGNAVISVQLAEATSKIKTVDDAFYSVAEVFFG